MHSSYGAGYADNEVFEGTRLGVISVFVTSLLQFQMFRYYLSALMCLVAVLTGAA